MAEPRRRATRRTTGDGATSDVGSRRRAAGRTAATGQTATGQTATGPAATGRTAAAGQAASGEAPRPAAPPPICQVPFCPICMTVTALGEIRPDVMEHLLLAGREMLLAFRAVVDAHLEGTPSKPAPKLERLTIE